MLIQGEWATDQAEFHSELQNTKTKSDRIIVIKEAVSFPTRSRLPIYLNQILRELTPRSPWIEGLSRVVRDTSGIRCQIRSGISQSN